MPTEAMGSACREVARPDGSELGHLVGAPGDREQARRLGLEPAAAWAPARHDAEEDIERGETLAQEPRVARLALDLAPQALRVGIRGGAERIARSIDRD